MSSSPIRLALLTSNLATYLQGGGHWSWFLQYAFGLRDLGVEFYWLEYLPLENLAEVDAQVLDRFVARVRGYGLLDQCRLLTCSGDDWHDELASRSISGTRSPSLQEIVATADAVWCFAGGSPRCIVERFRRRVLLDVDPGHLQVATVQLGETLDQYDVHLTIGQNVGHADCEVPTLDKRWQHFMPVVHLPSWPVQQRHREDGFLTSVTHWNWEDLKLGERVLSVGKRDAYVAYLSLPKRLRRRIELAAHIRDVPDTPDAQTFRAHCWRIVDPWEVASSPERYREYIAQSYAELCCPKAIHRLLQTGWVSERSAAYLASGRPVLMEDTGFSRTVPDGNGILYFRDLDSAVEATERLESDYEEHSRRARLLAEELFSSSCVLPRLIDLTFAN